MNAPRSAIYCSVCAGSVQSRAASLGLDLGPGRSGHAGTPIGRSVASSGHGAPYPHNMAVVRSTGEGSELGNAGEAYCPVSNQHCYSESKLVSQEFDCSFLLRRDGAFFNMLEGARVLRRRIRCSAKPIA